MFYVMEDIFVQFRAYHIFDYLMFLLDLIFFCILPELWLIKKH